MRMNLADDLSFRWIEGGLSVFDERQHSSIDFRMGLNFEPKSDLRQAGLRDAKEVRRAAGDLRQEREDRE
jgi:hypothetical protein